MKHISKGVEFVASDRTKQQREYLHKLKEKVDRENSTQGAVKKTIRYVRGSSTIVTIMVFLKGSTVFLVPVLLK
jgi:hypothetical protein